MIKVLQKIAKFVLRAFRCTRRKRVVRNWTTNFTEEGSSVIDKKFKK